MGVKGEKGEAGTTIIGWKIDYENYRAVPSQLTPEEAAYAAGYRDAYAEARRDLHEMAVKFNDMLAEITKEMRVEMRAELSAAMSRLRSELVRLRVFKSAAEATRDPEIPLS
jgi:hypothetical protein